MGIEKDLIYTYLVAVDPATEDLQRTATTFIAVDDQSVATASEAGEK